MIKESIVMNNRKFQPIRIISKLLTSSQSRALEENLKAQAKAEAYYMSMPMPRV